MESYQEIAKPQKMAAVAFSRIVQNPVVHRSYGTQRKGHCGIQHQFPQLNISGRKLALRRRGLAIIGKLFMKPQVLVPKVVFNIVRCKSNQVLNTVRYRSLRRSAALLLRAG